jgi:hypothetical protein
MFGKYEEPGDVFTECDTVRFYSVAEQNILSKGQILPLHKIVFIVL